MGQQLYPIITVSRIENPSRFYAFPLLGFIVKIIVLIPVFIEMMFLGNIGNSAMTPKSSSPYQNETFQDYEPTE